MKKNKINTVLSVKHEKKNEERQNAIKDFNDLKAISQDILPKSHQKNDPL